MLAKKVTGDHHALDLDWHIGQSVSLVSSSGTAFNIAHHHADIAFN